MAIFRNLNMSFWTDSKVVDDYTPEDRYFMVYALTNPYTNIIGCYEISIKQMANDLGYKEDVIKNLLKRFKEVHKTIDYDFETKELMVTNWYKYNWSTSPKLDPPLVRAIESIKSDYFHDRLASIYNKRESVIKPNGDETTEEDIVLIPYRYGIDTTITNTIPIPISIPISNPISISNKDNNKDMIPYKEICDYLNKLTNSNYRYSTKKTKDLIKARFNEGFTLEDFKTVIQKKTIDWINDKEFKKYLRPETLFGNKFESYLNQPTKELTTKDLNLDLSDFFN